MSRGLVHNKPARKDTKIEEAFAGFATVTSADITKLHTNGVNTVAQFAKIASDGDLTDNNFTSDESIRLIAAFEKTEFADLLDYAKDLGLVPAEEAEKKIAHPAVTGLKLALGLKP